MPATPPDLATTPLAANPSGDPPNFIDPPTKETQVIAVGSLLMCISVCFVSLRIFNNLKVVGKLYLDDYVCVVAQLLLASYIGLTFSLRDYLRHSYDTSVASIDASYIKRNIVINYIVGPSQWLCKVAILSLYIRIFWPKTWLRYSAYFIIAVTFGLYWSTIPLTGVYCSPRGDEGWGDLDIMSRCYHTRIMGPLLGAVGVTADLAILILPLPILLRLNVGTGKKTALAAIFLTGILGVVASIVSLYYRVIIFTGSDTFWHTGDVWTTIYAESHAALIVSCAPALSSFWINVASHSQLYSRLMSVFSSLSSFSMSSSSKSEKKSGEELTDRRTTYHELRDGPWGRNGADVATTDQMFKSVDGVITKSMSVDLSSDRV